MSGNQLTNDKWTELEYNHITSELSRYENTSQRVVTIVSALITIVFLVGKEWDFDYAFMAIPIISFITFQLLISNNYAYRVREMYLNQIEEHRTGFYSSQVSKFYRDLKWWEMMLHPFNAVIGIILTVMLFITFTSARYSYLMMKRKDGYYNEYLITIIVLFVYLLVSIIWSSWKISKKRSLTSDKLNEQTEALS